MVINVVVAERKIWAYALKNSLDYGSANSEIVFSKIARFIEDKSSSSMEEVKAKVAKICSEVNKLSLEERKELFEELKSEIESFSNEKKERKLLEAKNAVTRFLPEPNGYLHIGHAKALFLSYHVAKQNNGSFFLRFDDTNPEAESLEFVKAIKEDVEWLGVKYDKELYTSDFIPSLYEYAEKLIKQNNAYVCTCSLQEIKQNRKDKKECKCRDRSIEENIKLFEEMKTGKIDENKAVLRLKGNMKSENTTMRDPIIFRIKKAKHYRQGNKFFLYPTYDFAAPVVDSLTGITHAIRSKEYELRDELYYYILELLNLRKPIIIGISRLELKGFLTSKRKIKQLIKEKKLSSWDDPRLVTLKGLRKRGILPKAIEEFVLSFGISKTESVSEIEKLLSINRKLLDDKAKRMFFVQQPFKIVTNIENGKAIVKNHPTVDLGERKISFSNVFYIPKNDAINLKEGDFIRLKQLADLVILKKTKDEIQAKKIELTEEQKKKAKVLQWVSEDNVETKVLVPKSFIDENGNFIENSLEEVKGLAEKNILNIKQNEVVQFERFGFCNYIGNKTFVFSC